MNKTGISSACFYPLVTEKSFAKICKANIKCAELFINATSELETAFVKQIVEQQKEYGIDIPSVHPFMSFAESFFLFSSYERRFYDIMPLYERFFEVCNMLGAKIFVIHGAKIPGSIDDELYFERFAALIEKGKEYGVHVCQENVVHYRSESAEYLKRMGDYIGENFGVVLDIKQARRALVSPYDIINSVGKYIKHIHISDYDGQKDCIPPGMGKFDFSEFFNTMKNINYSGAYIIELYEHSYKNEQQIIDSYIKIKDLLIE